MLLIFKFRSTEDPENVNKIIEHVLHEKLQNAAGPPKVDPESVEIKSKLISLILFISLTQNNRC
jgi:transmembrane serine protease 11E